MLSLVVVVDSVVLLVVIVVVVVFSPGVLSAIRQQGRDATLSDQRIVVAGAGSAGMGVAAALLSAMVKEGMTPEVPQPTCNRCTESPRMRRSLSLSRSRCVAFACSSSINILTLYHRRLRRSDSGW
jgi:hypothetical protein